MREFSEHLRMFAAVLSLANAASVVGERLLGGAASIATAVDDPTVRLRLWVSAGLFTAVGSATLGRQVIANRDVLDGFAPGAGRRGWVNLAMGSVECLMAAVLAAILLWGG